jgi:hypothetical protein
MSILSIFTGPRTTLAAVLLTGIVAASSAAQAGPEPCSVGMVKAEGSNAQQCQNGNGNNDFLNDGLAVNTQDFFGHDDWIFLERKNGTEENVDIGLAITGSGAISGTWSTTAAALEDYDDFMIVLKAGTQWAGFLFDDSSADDGTWGYGTTPALSHISVYARGTNSQPVSNQIVAQIPEPTALALIGAGLLALAGFRRRA